MIGPLMLGGMLFSSHTVEERTNTVTDTRYVYVKDLTDEDRRELLDRSFEKQQKLVPLQEQRELFFDIFKGYVLDKEKDIAAVEKGWFYNSRVRKVSEAYESLTNTAYAKLEKLENKMAKIKRDVNWLMECAEFGMLDVVNKQYIIPGRE